MKISLLLKREPFGEILEQSLAGFLNDFYGNGYKVKWLARNQWDNEHSQKSDQKWICNPLINSIYVKEAKYEVFYAIKWEYSKNPLKPWRSAFQRLYLQIAIKSKFGPLLASYSVMISPEISNARNMLIIGGNTKIRVIDHTNKTVFVILKRGFNKKYLEREILVRQNYGYLPIPSLKQIGTFDWYSEEYVSGISPDRLKKEIGNQILAESTQTIHKLLTDTALEEELKVYTGMRVSKITDKLENINQISDDKKRYILQIVNVIISDLKKISRYQKNKIFTAITHGDFQPGNILYDGNKTWILDWEYSRRRQIGNDLFVLILNPRNPIGFACRFLNLANNKLKEINRSLLLNWPFLNWQNESSRRISLRLYLLEEIDFLLEENDNPFFYGQTYGLNPFLNELKQIMRYLSDSRSL